MRFASPEWFLLLPLLAAAGWFWRGLQLHKLLRIFCVIVITVILAKPQIRRHSEGLDLWVLVDQSDSVKDLLQPKLPEWETILDKSKGSADRIHYIDFASESVKRGAQMRSGSDGQRYAGPRDSSRLSSAVQFATAQMHPGRASRMLVLTDGFSTEPLDGLASRLLEQETALDFRLAISSVDGDYRVAAFVLPRRVQIREAFLAEVVVFGDRDGTVPVELIRDGQSIGTKEVVVTNGMGRLRFTDRLGAAGAFQYEARLMPQSDALPGNNVAMQWVEVQSGPRIVLITSYENDPLQQVLQAQGFEVEMITESSAAHIGKLSGAKVVILNNVPAYRMDAELVRGLDFFVNQQGGGLAMIGGKYSFASGGWFGSPVEPLLPVSMELKQEHRKLSVAMAIVMDRSGSMAMSVPGTSLQKMDLANEGAARAVGLLGDHDFASIFAVDSAAHMVSPLVAVGKNRGTLQNVARKVDSAGGGIFVYTGLDAAWKELKKSQVGQRHIILFADAADAEEPGKYKELLAEMAKEKGTVSVIGLGSDKDSDAAFLQDVAKLGGGRVFFNENPTELPALFAQETVAVARSAFLEEPVEIKGTPGWMEMAAGTINWLPKVDGYNLSYIRPGATQAAVSGDEYAAPMVAFWQRGAGRVASISFPLGGDFSTSARQWPEYGGFIQSFARWLMGEQVPPGIGLRASMDGSRLKADLFYDESWNDRISENAPELVLAAGADATPLASEWERLGPGHFRATAELQSGSFVRGAVRIGRTALPFGPVNSATNPEWSFDKSRLEELRGLSARSGGMERVDLSDVWKAPRPPAWKDLQLWLLPLLLIGLLLEAWQTRTGWNWLRGSSKPAPTPAN